MTETPATPVPAALAAAVKPPSATPAPVASLAGHPWQAAVIAGQAFAAELGKIGSDGRAWVVKEVGVATADPKVFVLGLGVGALGGVIGAVSAVLMLKSAGG